MADCLEYPGNFVFLGRRTLVDFMISTYQTLTIKSTLSQLSCAGLATENRQQKIFQFWNGSRLFYGGLDAGEEQGREKVFSTEFGSIYVDEAWEMTEEQFVKLGSRLRHTLPDGAERFAALNSQGKKMPPYHISLASNPAQNWLKTRFIAAPGSDEIFIPALARDNPFNPDDYEARLRDLFRGDEKMAKAYVEGCWDAVGSIDDLVTASQVAACREAAVTGDGRRKVVSCDPGRFGDDQTVILLWVDNALQKIVRMSKKDTMEVCGHLVQAVCELGGGARIVVDETGLGAGIVDRLREMGREAVGVHFSARADEAERFANKRAEMYWHARRMILDRKVRIPADAALAGQLAAVKYRFCSDGRILIEPKEELKKRLGRSPDEADAFVLGLEGLRGFPDGIQAPAPGAAGWTVPASGQAYFD